MKVVVWLLCVLGLVACRKSAGLPDYYGVPPFQLIDQSGRAFDSRNLNGKIWVADFIYTTCPGPCPRMSSEMHQVEEETADVPGVHLVSFSIDPEHDTPAVLASYARLYRAPPDRWTFLTGPLSELQRLSRDVFKLGDINPSLEHSTRFILIDRHERVRGYYENGEPGSIAKVVEDVRALARDQR